ncbi:chemotaxis protein [Shigella sonnei]|nr:chemotaxis protein [Escherichia coli]OYE75345.1 chemotaxis protein [Shigella sonnei]ATV76072.1 chemotaxis protein [Escherichia coli]ATX36159.1 chemotaxis protein [Escherichia coli]AUY46679.1 chemotaxis protein [Escherichia coli]
MPGTYQSQSLSGIICRVVWLTFSVVTNGAIVIHTQRLKSDPGGNLLS